MTTFDIKNIELHVGLEIVIRKDSPEKEERIVGKIIGWDQDNFIIVKVPNQANINQFPLNTPMIIGYVNEGIVYGFNSKLLLIFKYKESGLFLMGFPIQHEKIQLRKEKRIKVSIKGSYKLSDDEDKAEDSAVYNFCIVDLCTSGCAITTTDILKVGKTIHLSFILPLKGEITDLPALVVNISKPSSDEFKYGIKFMDDNQLSMITSYKSVIDMVDQ